MPELSALTQARVPALNFQPINPATYINPGWVPKPLPPDLRKAYQIEGHAAMMGAAAHAIGSLPDTFNKAYTQGQSMALNTQQNQQNLSGLQLKSDLMSGNVTPEQRQNMSGLTIGPTGATSVTIQDPRLQEAELANARLKGLTTGQREYNQANTDFGPGPNVPANYRAPGAPGGVAPITPTQPASPAPLPTTAPTQTAPASSPSTPVPPSGIGAPTTQATPTPPTPPLTAPASSPSIASNYDVNDKSIPASIRYNNPGAQYPGKSATKYGSTGYGVIGGGNKIAHFSDPVQGAAAQFDLLGRSYAGMPLNSAIKKWSGNNSDEYANSVANSIGIPSNTILTRDTLADPSVAVPLAKAMARYEAGRPFPMSDDQWHQAHGMAFGGGNRVAASPVDVNVETPLPTGGVSQAQPVSAPANLSGLAMTTGEPINLSSPALSSLSVSGPTQIPLGQLASIGQPPGASMSDQPGAASNFGAPASIIPGAMDPASQTPQAAAPALANMEVRRATEARLPGGTIVTNSFSPNTGDTISPDGVKGKFQPFVKPSAATQKLLSAANYQPKAGETEPEMVANAQALMKEQNKVPLAAQRTVDMWARSLPRDPVIQNYTKIREALNKANAALQGGGLDPGQAVAMLDGFTMSQTGGRATVGMTKVFQGAQTLSDKIKIWMQGLGINPAARNAKLSPELATEMQKIMSQGHDLAKSEVENQRDADADYWGDVYDVPKSVIQKRYNVILGGGHHSVTPDASPTAASPAAGGTDPAIQKLQEFLASPEAKSDPGRAGQVRAILKAKGIQAP